MANKRLNYTLVTMLRRTVQRRPYDWKPLTPAILQAFRSIWLEATRFNPQSLTFGRKMRLPIDVKTPLLAQPRDVRTYANFLLEDLEWCLRVARE